MLKYFIFTLLITTCCLEASSQKKNATGNAALSSSFDAFIQNAMPLWKTPGLSVVVVKDGNVVFKKAYGVIELGKPDPFTTTTLSICASTTKAMTAVCMAMLVDDGKIKWSDKVSDVFPELKLYDNYANAEIIIKDLFTHNTGLGNADWLWVLGVPVDSIIRKMRLLKPEYSLRSSFVYQNLMYLIAGEVIHKVSGKPFDQFISERLFKPLDMQHTYPSYALSVNEPKHISPHYIFDDTIVKPIPLIDLTGIDAAGGVWSSADDINKWMLFLLDSAKVNGEHLLKPATYAALFKPESICAADFYPTAKLTKPHWTTYGLGWFQQDYHGKMVNFHTGSLDGAVAICGLINDENFGIYVFGNLDHSEIRHALMYKAMDLWVFGDNKNDWSTDIFKMYEELKVGVKKEETDFEAKRVADTKPTLAIKEYTGKYHHEVYGDAVILNNADSLTLQYPNNIHVNLSHWHYDTFLGRFDYEWYGKDWLTFKIDAEGKVASFTFIGIEYLKEGGEK